jgi:hypothetical protein
MTTGPVKEFRSANLSNAEKDLMGAVSGACGTDTCVPMLREAHKVQQVGSQANASCVPATTSGVGLMALNGIGENLYPIMAIDRSVPEGHPTRIHMMLYNPLDGTVFDFTPAAEFDTSLGFFDYDQQRSLFDSELADPSLGSRVLALLTKLSENHPREAEKFGFNTPEGIRKTAGSFETVLRERFEKGLRLYATDSSFRPENATYVQVNAPRLAAA